jgi:hypothetical protein
MAGSLPSQTVLVGLSRHVYHPFQGLVIALAGASGTISLAVSNRKKKGSFRGFHVTRKEEITLERGV